MTALTGDLLRHRWVSPLATEKAEARAAVRAALAEHGAVGAASAALGISRAQLHHWLDAVPEMSAGLTLAGPGRPVSKD